ncbi:hydrogenase maturation factor carbamoyltransferase protein HypF (plasmid) [Rhizobium etli bv. mimosae str. IE4771]|uniref:Carbamoyltransferase HypF n=1 Tax=Rhizobium etli bv. mimosae str. IE4771 TaxID=1432050 RepID=A0A060IEC6_RHIET|nr:carbamoyltransferase HypF [Rhizobium sp. IE4771]AIC30036.1 hydrogenase maturation factor carbamoyltransferase protein HypF [Rhizobium sp. IE4771]
MAPALTRQIEKTVRRLRLRVRGTVQGVGFRPFAYRLARGMGLTGFVLNDGAGVLVEIEGSDVNGFAEAIRTQAPPLARIDSIDVVELVPTGGELFEILKSLGGATATRIGADAATCDECRRDLRDPASRFFGYPFVNCTHCGPRLTITRTLPYDRAKTSMAPFPMCRACAADYADPESRRFHAEPVACPDCGPKLSHPVAEVAARLASGKIVALKGIGGFHLLCDARNNAAIGLLRLRKSRHQKPFAVMVRDIEAARRLARLTATEEALLMSAAAPIVLVEPLAGQSFDLIAPNLARIGIMLAYAPVHHLLFDALVTPASHGPPALVATSANPSEEPLIADNADAERRLGEIADLIVTHDRDIAIRADDSIMQVIDGAPAFIRRARGFVPEPVDLGADGPSVIGTGADLKNTVCVTRGREAFLSQHVGGLDNAEAIRFQREVISHLCSTLDVKPEYAACDCHPDFRSVRMAEGLSLPVVPVQHHLAHVAAVAAEHRLRGPVLGLALDGHGFGSDGTGWGGEMLALDGHCWLRAGSLVPLPLPGGDRAAREPWRMAVAALRAAGRIDLAPRLWPDHPGVAQLTTMFDRGMRPSGTTSLGRLFDGAAAIAGIGLTQGYEGQTAMEFEALVHTPRCLPDGYSITNGKLDFLPLIRCLAEQGLGGIEAADLFHGTLIAGLADWAAGGAARFGSRQIALSGGCMMNRVLAAGLLQALRARDFEAYLPRLAPANDGGIALGQVAYARHVVMNENAISGENLTCA